MLPTKRTHTSSLEDQKTKRIRLNNQPQNQSSSSDKLYSPSQSEVEALSPTSTSSTLNNNCLMWFRSDLRIYDNPALYAASQQARKNSASLFALYVISPEDHRLHDDAPIKVDFRLRSLSALNSDLSDLHIPLRVEIIEPRSQIPSTIQHFCAQYGISNVFYNAEYEVDENKRDTKVVALLRNKGINVHVTHDQCVVRPGDLVAVSTGRPYTVYTPFKNSWMKFVKSQKSTGGTLLLLELSPGPQPNDFSIRKDPIFKELFSQVFPASLAGFEVSPDLAAFAQKNYEAGESAAHAKLEFFISDRINTYHITRDKPLPTTTTSRLSFYLAAGVLSARQCVRAAWDANKRQLDSGNQGIVTWIQEIIWREFFRHILNAFPHVCKYQPFKEEGREIVWAEGEEEEERFRAWTEGRTGWPIVDAGMRQLNSEGWMHNRLRMITASYLCKDLLINWQKGEKYFYQHLIDGDFASNNGGWQWCASTGCDAQPYFRIFNPLLQSERFDPDGKYIARYIPELARLKGKPAIHDPARRLSADELNMIGYPRPMIDHVQAKDRALMAYSTAFKKRK